MFALLSVRASNHPNPFHFVINSRFGFILLRACNAGHAKRSARACKRTGKKAHDAGRRAGKRENRGRREGAEPRVQNMQRTTRGWALMRLFE